MQNATKGIPDIRGDPLTKVKGAKIPRLLSEKPENLRVNAYALRLPAISIYRLLILLSLSAFITTQKLDRLIAAAPNIGLSSHPNTGIKTPAARGMPIML